MTENQNRLLLSIIELPCRLHFFIKRIPVPSGMIRTCFFIAALLLASGCEKTENAGLPEFMTGSFQDDYSINYEITDSLWFQKPRAKFHITDVNLELRYIIAKNDTGNPSKQGFYTRFDWMKLENMDPYTWGFCMTIYDAETIQEAKEVQPPDRENPKTGCNGFPFSRMKRIKTVQQ